MTSDAPPRTARAWALRLAVGLLAIVAAALLVIGTPAHRSRNRIPKRLLLTPSDTGLPPGLSLERFRRELDAAAATWSYPRIPCTSLQIQVGETISRRLVADDGQNQVVFRDPWCHNGRCGHTRTFPISAAAMTTVRPEGAGTQAIREADIELNAVHYDWSEESAADHSGSAGAGKRRVALRAVLVHELGHLLGFPDACEGAGQLRQVRKGSCMEAERQGVMFAKTYQLQPSQAEVAALCRWYPR